MNTLLGIAFAGGVIYATYRWWAAATARLVDDDTFDFPPVHVGREGRWDGLDDVWAHRAYWREVEP